jgi:restriction system protein
MAIPDFQTVMLPALLLYADGQVHALGDIRKVLETEFALTEEERKAVLPSGSQTVFRNRVGWAVTHLRKAGLIAQTRFGYAQLTTRGKTVLDQSPTLINIAFLDKFPEHVAFRASSRSGQKPINSMATTEEDRTPEEAIEYGHVRLREGLARDVLERIRSCSSAFFEKLVVELLVKMGYGGSFRDAAEVVGRSGDGGIDGIIKEDKLGLDMIYVQAKRWEGNVGRPEIQKFVGALAGHGAQKGVFITTSNFTTDALEYARNRVNNIKIVLLDGEKPGELMMDHNLGVSTARVFEVKRVDSDYFSEE